MDSRRFLSTNVSYLDLFSFVSLSFNTLFRYECGDMIQSEEFPPYDLQKEFWTLRLYPKGHQRLAKEQQNASATGGASSTDDDSAVQFYLTLCPSHVASQNPSNASAGSANGAGSNNPNHIASSMMNTSSRQLQVFFRALINFSNPQVRLFFF